MNTRLLPSLGVRGNEDKGRNSNSLIKGRFIQGMHLEISEETYLRLEKLRAKKFERRPGEVPLGRFLENLISEYLDKLELSQKHEPLLEEYLVEADRVFVKDNLNKQIVELNFREGKLFCLFDQDYNCVHVGFSWSDPRVVALIAQRELRKQEEKK